MRWGIATPGRATRSGCRIRCRRNVHAHGCSSFTAACKKLGMCHSCRSVTQNLGFQDLHSSFSFQVHANLNPSSLVTRSHVPDSNP